MDPTTKDSDFTALDICLKTLPGDSNVQITLKMLTGKQGFLSRDELNLKLVNFVKLQPRLYMYKPL